MGNWYQKSKTEVVSILKTDTNNGLQTTEVLERLKVYGLNNLQDKGKKGWRQMLLHQITDTMIVILIFAMLISALAADHFDTLVIGFIITVNVLMGFFQEYKTEQALQALKAKSNPIARVIRNGLYEEISATQLVPGDIVILEAGVRVPADGRVIESIGLKVEESSLTGESEAIEKTVHKLDKEQVTIGDQINMTFMGTLVTNGRGKIIVTETGMQTQIGKIANLIQNNETETPLQKRLASMGKIMAWCALVVCIIIYVLGLIRGESFQVMTMTAISLAVAIVPESLPTVVTIVLALGAKKMLKQKALIRKLSAVETLGSVSVICSDKTGTLTQKGMRVEHLYDLQDNDFPTELDYLALGMILCNDAILDEQDAEGGIGDPTEIALLLKAKEMGYLQEAIDNKYPRVMEIPFDSNRKLMSTLHQFQNQYIMFTKGAFDNLINKCGRIWQNGAIKPWTEEKQRNLELIADEMAVKGIRVLAFGYKIFENMPEKLTLDSEKDLIFMGLVGIVNPLRKEVLEAVQICHRAGIKIVMITGDHPLTAKSIGKQLGIIKSENELINGNQLEEISFNELINRAKEISVYARVSPEHKMKIVEALQANRQVVAMTGDGINDAPALKKADIGVAMGITGTDVSKQAADMVLLDDNFTTIVKAVEMGRTIYDNIRKFICYMLTANFAETIMMVLAMAFGLPLPLMPIHILWINLFAEGLPAFALSMEPSEQGVMKRPVRPANESIFARGIGFHILWVGCFMALLSLGLLIWFNNIPQWQSMVLTTFALLQLFHVLAIRSTSESLFTIGIFSNPTLLLIVFIFTGMQTAILYLEPLQNIFKTTALSLNQLLLCLILSSTVFILVEIEKWFFRGYIKRNIKRKISRRIIRKGIFE